MGEIVQNVLQFSDVLWAKIQPLMDEYNLVSMKIFQSEAKDKDEIGELYRRIRVKLEIEMTDIIKEFLNQ